jgi:aminopeptidase YwaD
MTPRIIPVLVAIFIAGGGPAFGQSVADPPKSSSPNITTDEIGYHAQWLASDALEGRGTGTKANDIAAEYIAREFARYGLKPFGPNGQYLQTFDVVTGVELGKKNSLTVTTDGGLAIFQLKKDFLPMSFSETGSASGAIVCVGYGISAPQQKRDDYASIDVKGKIVLAFRGNPEDSPHSELDAVSSMRSKAMFAREKGAAALLLVHPDKDEVEPLKYDTSPSRSGIIVVSISQTAANMLLRSAQTDVARLAKESKETSFKAFPISGSTMALDASVELIHHNSSNVIGIVEGTDTETKGRYFVVGAHFDHLGWGQDGSLYRGTTPMIHHGADDNASGTSGMLELAQYFAAHPARHSMLFMAFTGEEMGLLGSSYWAEHPTTPLKSISAMFNLDMIGRLPDSTKRINVQGTGTSPVWESIVKAANEPYSFDLALVPDGQGASDQSTFYMKSIPVLFFFTGLHTDYHRPSDTFETLNIPGEQRVVRYIADIITRTDGEKEPIAFVRVKKSEDQRVRGFNVYVGTIPDYGSSSDGFKINGTSPGSPAEKAGLKAGDIIVQFGETKIKNIYDYMNALGLHKPEEDVPVKVKRGGEEVALTIHLVKK